ncbi:hypothetical protein [Nocardioides sp.]|uniref:hypothetical protein n=1 Tax=Nocardioides sp. TaxID=35761 RepID=UPI001D85E97F|nr:hypothetical protein [Nocardioides sp.]MBU1801129.1 hypothetical protein [Actinomycetota bacterium]
MTTDGPQEPVRHEFAFAPAYRVAALPFGIAPRTSWVHIGPDELSVRYGPWSLSTPVHNIAEASLSGGFTFLKTAGPPHLSLADRGVSFTTNPHAAVCLRFHRPVRAIDPTGLLKNPGATLSVRDPQALLADVRRLVPAVGLVDQ